MAGSGQFSSVTQSRPTLRDPMDCSMPGLPVHHQVLEFTQSHVHWVGDAIQPSHPLSSPSPPAFNRSQHRGLFQWVSSSQQLAKVLEFQLLHQAFQWLFRNDLPFPFPVDHVLWELSSVTCPFWVALYSMAHSFIELDEAVVHVIRLVRFLWLWF